MTETYLAELAKAKNVKYDYILKSAEKSNITITSADPFEGYKNGPLTAEQEAILQFRIIDEDTDEEDRQVYPSFRNERIPLLLYESSAPSSRSSSNSKAM